VKHRLGRSQRHHRRPRTIYALILHQGHACYVGQSVDLNERVAQHRCPAGGWEGASFEVISLEVANTTEAEAVELEYAWRLVAVRKGYMVFGKPGAVVDPLRRATWSRRFKSWGRSWPSGSPMPQKKRDPFWVPLGLMMVGVWLMW
jgi:predicted GIY-YIG superfamily endonuclease